MSHCSLISFGNDSPSYLSFDVHFVSNIPLYDSDDDDGSVIEPSLDILCNPINQSSLDVVDPSSCYLYTLDLQLQSTKSDCTCFYQSSTTQTIDFRHLLAHMDAGWMASTSNCLHFCGIFNPWMILLLLYTLQMILLTLLIHLDVHLFRFLYSKFTTILSPRSKQLFMLCMTRP